MTNDNKFIGLGVSADSELYKRFQEQGSQVFIFDVGVSWKGQNNLTKGDRSCIEN